MPGPDGGPAHSQPVFARCGDLIAFIKIKQSGGQILIGVMCPNGKLEPVVTEGDHNEARPWRPTGAR